MPGMSRICRLPTAVRNHLFFCILTALLVAPHLRAQQQPAPLKAVWAVDSVQVSRNATFSNVLVLHNTAADTLSVTAVTPVLDYAGALLNPKAPVKLAPGNTARLPIKMLANTAFLKQNVRDLTYSIQYTSSTGPQQATASFSLQKEEFRDIILMPLQREIYADPAQPHTIISFVVDNRGFADRSLEISIKTEPEALVLSAPRQTLTLGPLEQKRIELTVNTPRQTLRYPEYRISITARDQGGDEQVGYTEIMYTVLTANRQLTPVFNSMSLENFAELNYTGYSGGYDMLNLRANKALTLAGDWKGRLNINTDYYPTSSLYSVYDTWAEATRGRTALRVGNIQGTDYDYAVTGRGARAAAGIGSHSEIEALALENEYSLFGSYFSGSRNARMAGVKFSYGRTRPTAGKISYLYEDNLRLATESHQAHWTDRWALHKDHLLQLAAGVSSEEGKIRGDHHYGAVGTVNYEGKAGSWAFSSFNTVATSAYTGLTRGTLMLNERVSRQLSGGSTVFLNYEQNRSAPKYLGFQQVSDLVAEPLLYPRYYYSTRSATLGWQVGWHRWNFMWAPRVEQQRSENNTFVRELLAYRLQSSASTVFGAHNINLSAEYSYARHGGTDWFSSLRATASYRYRELSVTGTVQHNPLYVTELPADGQPIEQFTNYNVYASYALRKTDFPLVVNLSAGFNYSQLYNNINTVLNAQLEYKTKSNWAATAFVNYGDFRTLITSGYRGSNYQFRLGIKKYFNTATEQGNYKVALQLFEDRNSNGLVDDGEPPVAEQLVRLDKYIARTDRQGKVSFLNVPSGTYTLRITDKEGAPSTEFTLNVTSNIRKKLGTVQKIRIAGRMQELRQEYDKVLTSAVGTNVYARDTAGKVYTTVVDQQDRFEFLLAPGTYEIYIQSDQFTYENPSQTVRLDPEKEPAELVFRYRKKDTEVRVKRF